MSKLVLKVAPIMNSLEKAYFLENVYLVTKRFGWNLNPWDPVVSRPRRIFKQFNYVAPLIRKLNIIVYNLLRQPILYLSPANDLLRVADKW
jgi:hypothetical protein